MSTRLAFFAMLCPACFSPTGSTSSTEPNSTSDTPGEITGVDVTGPTSTGSESSPTTTTSTAGTQPSTCGGGTVEMGEECDDGNQTDDDGCSNECYRPRYMFTTLGIFTGNLGGLEGADAFCAGEAARAGLQPGSAWFAWLADESGSPSSRFETTFSGWYLRPDQQKIAKGWLGLIDEMLVNAPNVSAGGSPITLEPMLTWTNVGDDGSMQDPDMTCESWTYGTTGKSGGIGDASTAMKAWSYLGAANCGFEARLYCIEQ